MYYRRISCVFMLTFSDLVEEANQIWGILKIVNNTAIECLLASPLSLYFHFQLLSSFCLLGERLFYLTNVLEKERKEWDNKSPNLQQRFQSLEYEYVEQFIMNVHWGRMNRFFRSVNVDNWSNGMLFKK